MGWFRKKLVRYAAVIALIGALASACKKEIPKLEAKSICDLSNKIGITLSRGEVDKKNIREFVGIIAQVRRKFPDKKIEVPQNLEEGIKNLTEYYSLLDVNRDKNIIYFNENFLLIRSPAGFLVDLLKKAERSLGLRLEDERKDLKGFLESLRQHIYNELAKEGKINSALIAEGKKPNSEKIGYLNDLVEIVGKEILKLEG